MYFTFYAAKIGVFRLTMQIYCGLREIFFYGGGSSVVIP